MTKNPPPAAHGLKPAPAPAKAGLVSRVMGLPGWLWRHKLVATGLGVVLALVIGGAAAGTFMFPGKVEKKPPELLADALARLDAGDNRQARQIAAQLRASKDLSYIELGGPMFVLGVVTAREAQEHFNPTEQRTLYLVASRYLEESRTRGFPEGREQEGLALLGRALHHSGRYAQSLPYLSEALHAQPKQGGELPWLLADSSLHLVPPKLDDALRYTQQYLASPDLTRGEQDAGRLLESQILLAKNKPAESQAALAKIDETSPLAAEAAVMRARILTQQAADTLARGHEISPETCASLETSITALRGIQSKEPSAAGVVAQAQFLMGKCYELIDDRRAAIAQYDRVRRTYFGRPEALAATIFQADLVRAEGNAGEAVALYQRAIGGAGPRDAYQNTWLSLDDLERRLAAASEDLLEKHEYMPAQELSRGLTPLLPEVFAAQQQVAVHSAWAKKLVADAAPQPLDQSEVTLAEARQQWREAGAASQRLAELRVATRYYLDDLAAAGQLFRQGQGYRQAAKVYQALLKQDPQHGQPEALVGLGESLLALGQVDAARAALARCRETFPKHPATYQARLLESAALAEQGQLAPAKELLVDNLYRHALTPQSSDWRDSLFALGMLLYREAAELETKSRVAGVDQVAPETKQEGLKLLEQCHGVVQEAVRTLTEAIERYPTAAQVFPARYRIAEAHRLSAKWPRKKLGVVTIETSRLALNRQLQQELLLSVEQYNRLIADLSDQGKTKQRPAEEVAILRNCYFGRADALFDLGRYEEAIAAYSAATNRYQQMPEALEAYVQIAACYRRLGRPQEARGTLEQARVVLSRIRPDADFTRATRLDRQQWTDLLAWLRTL